jgi:hypothetical protein
MNFKRNDLRKLHGKDKNLVYDLGNRNDEYVPVKPLHVCMGHETYALN